VVEGGVAEVGGIGVTLAAFARKVPGRRLVTGRTIRISDDAVIKIGGFEVSRVCVTQAAGALVVVGWRVVARRAVLIANGAVIKNTFVEICTSIFWLL